MDYNDDKAFWASAQAKVEQSWSEVFDIVNQLLKNHSEFGFELIQKRSNPSLQDMHLSLQSVKGMLTGVAEFPGIDYALSRLAVNAVQQIHHVEQLIASLERQSKEEYLDIIACLARQAQI